MYVIDILPRPEVFDRVKGLYEDCLADENIYIYIFVNHSPIKKGYTEVQIVQRYIKDPEKDI